MNGLERYILDNEPIATVIMVVEDEKGLQILMEPAPGYAVYDLNSIWVTAQEYINTD